MTIVALAVPAFIVLMMAALAADTRSVTTRWLAALVAAALIVAWWHPEWWAMPRTSREDRVALDNVPGDVGRWWPVVAGAAEAEGVDPRLLLAMVWQESGGRPDALGTKYYTDGRPYPRHCLATGLIQVMPREAGACYKNKQGVSYFQDRPTQAELLDPAFNVAYSARHLRRLIDANGGNVWLAVEQYNGAGAEARRYVRAVQALYRRLSPAIVAVTQGGQSVAQWAFTGFATDPAGVGRKTSNFGRPNTYQTCGLHTGDDFGSWNSHRAPMLAVATGVVRYVGPLYGGYRFRGDQNVILEVGLVDLPAGLRGIDERDCVGRGTTWRTWYTIPPHQATVSVVYNHLDEAIVTPGQTVRAGEVIGYQGAKGYCTSGVDRCSHLHFEVRVGSPYTGNPARPWDVQDSWFIDPRALYPR